MKLLPIILLTSIVHLLNSQKLYIQDLTNNNGYIPIKEEKDIRIIDHYHRVFHFINLTQYHHSIETIEKNIKLLDESISDTKPLLETIKNNFVLLKVKINNLSPNFRNKRGLINALGKGIKFITGNLDSEDEKEIKNTLETLTKGMQNNSIEMNSFVQISETLSSQIRNTTMHINKQQAIVTRYINNFRNEIQNKISTLEDEVIFLKHIYQVDNDITLLRNHVDDIGQVIFTSKLGIIPTDILDQQELQLIEDFESYTNIKINVIFLEETISIVLSIPKYSPNSLSKITFEPIPNKENKSLYLEENQILLDKNLNIFHINTLNNLIKNLKPFSDPCIENIVHNNEAKCTLRKFDFLEVKEIKQGFLLFKNFYGNLTENCIHENHGKFSGTFILKFENCNVTIENKIYYNDKLKLKENVILSHLITDIKENKTFIDLKLEDLYVKQLSYENKFKNIDFKHNTNKILNITSNGINVIIVIIIIILTFFIYKRKINVYNISSEPQFNGGGVTITPNKVII